MRADYQKRNAEPRDGINHHGVPFRRRFDLEGCRFKPTPKKSWNFPISVRGKQVYTKNWIRANPSVVKGTIKNPCHPARSRYYNSRLVTTRIFHGATQHHFPLWMLAMSYFTRPVSAIANGKSIEKHLLSKSFIRSNESAEWRAWCKITLKISTVLLRKGVGERKK